MNKTGTIEQIVPDGGYQGQKGYIHTFQMTVKCPDGTFTGQIGSKSAVYPMTIGQEISVEVTNTEQHGVRFKKFNPQYAQGGSQGGGGQKADPNRELTIKRGNALNAVMSATTIPSDLIGDYLAAAVNWIDTGRWQVLPPNVQGSIPLDSFPDDGGVPF